MVFRDKSLTVYFYESIRDYTIQIEVIDVNAMLELGTVWRLELSPIFPLNDSLIQTFLRSQVDFCKPVAAIENILLIVYYISAPWAKEKQTNHVSLDEILYIFCIFNIHFIYWCYLVFESPSRGTCLYPAVVVFVLPKFLHFFVTKRSSLPSKLVKPLWSTTTCMHKHAFCLSSAKCWFWSLVPIVKCAHCRHYNLACLSVANNTNTRDRIVGNGHILQWDLMSKINILRSWDKKYVYTITHIRSSAPNMFAKFGWKTRKKNSQKSGKSDCQIRVRQTIILAIVCLTRVWQSLFCDKTIEFAIQTWRISLEHYYMLVVGRLIGSSTTRLVP